MAYDTDILIAGGGLNGLTLALALRSAGFDVTLVDPVPATVRGDAAFDGRGYALAISFHDRCHVTTRSLYVALRQH